MRISLSAAEKLAFDIRLKTGARGRVGLAEFAFFSMGFNKYNPDDSPAARYAKAV